MAKKIIAILLSVLSALALFGCGSKEPSPPPDLVGGWIQPTENDWFHIATITDDTIEVWWYLPSENKKDLYWSGTFTAPTDGREPYVWTSENKFSQQEMDASFYYNRTSREETKEFTYKDGKLSYNVTSGHLRLTFTLEKVDADAAKK